MATTGTETVEVSQALAELLDDVDGLRVYWYIADTTRPPACVIGLPDIDYADATSGFCAAVWSYPLTLVVSRSNDRDAQLELSRLVRDVVFALKGPVPAGVFDVQPIDARPIPVTVAGQELPGYLLNVRVRA